LEEDKAITVLREVLSDKREDLTYEKQRSHIKIAVEMLIKMGQKDLVIEELPSLHQERRAQVESVIAL
jgi:hypothetical protein